MFCIPVTTFLLCGFSCLVCGCGNQYEKALALFDQEKWHEAMAEAEKTPKEDGKLQYHIGRVYANGFGGVEKDRKTALSWYEKSAAKNCVDGLLACAQYYATGDGGTTKDEKRAHEFVERAAGLGSIDAKCNLGIDYLNGIGVAKDEVKGVKLIRETAEAGYDHGMFLTGLFFKEGRQVKRDLVEAMEWFKAAAAKGSRKAMFELAYAYGLGDQCEYNLHRDFAKGVEYLKKSAELKLPYAQRIYGVYLMFKNYMGLPVKDGKVVEPEDAKMGAKYILAAAEQDDVKAMFIAGKIYWEGASFYGVERNENKAIEFWQKAASTDKNAKNYYEAIKKKGITYPLKHDDLTPVESVESFCSIPLYSSGVGKTGHWKYKFKDDGDEQIEWFELKKPFRIYKKANLHYTPLTKTLCKIDLLHMSLEGDSYDNFAEYIVIREVLTKKYGVLPKVIAPETYPATSDDIVVPSYLWSVGDLVIELKSDHNPIRNYGNMTVSAYSKRIAQAAKTEQELWGKMAPKNDDGDAL